MSHEASSHVRPNPAPQQAEQAVRLQASLLDAVEQAVIATDLDGRIIYWNRFAETLYGWPAAEVLGRDIIEVNAARPVRGQAAELMAHLREGRRWSGEFLARRKDGTAFRVMSTHSPIYDENGLLAGAVGVSYDLTERKRAEEAIRKSEESLARAQQIAQLGSWDWDLISNQVAWSDEVYRIFGLSRDEFGGTYDDVLRSIHAEDVEGVKRKAEAELKRQDAANMDFRIVRPDGTVRVINGQSQVYFDDEGRAVRMSGIMQDITERVLAEEQLKSSNDKLRALSARLQSVREEESLRIAREIHDELGGALTALKFDLSWLGKQLAKSRNEALHQRLKGMAEMVDETVQKVRSISTELRPSVLDHLGLAAAIEWQAGEFGRRTEIECRIVSLTEEGDLSAEKATAVFRIFQEILTNVARHARATIVEISLEEHDEDIVLRVADNGLGIGPRALSDSKSLGLLGMRERALVFGGRVDIQGAQGQGTTVTVSIPRA